jgi:thioredoxin-related protein
MPHTDAVLILAGSLSGVGFRREEAPMIDRREFTSSLCGLALFTALPAMAAAAEVGGDGLHIQPWFMQTFLDLADDKAETEEAGKHFAVIFEQRGCPYCREMHEVNFARDDITGYVTSHFGILQLNLWGSREVTDFDGETLEERDLARKWGVNFTPTTVFFSKGGDPASAREAEVLRMPGYFKPFHFISMYEFVAEERYGDQVFQRYLQEKFERYEEEGKVPDLW